LHNDYDKGEAQATPFVAIRRQNGISSKNKATLLWKVSPAPVFPRADGGRAGRLRAIAPADSSCGAECYPRPRIASAREST
jgi:hypothetical protein